MAVAIHTKRNMVGQVFAPFDHFFNGIILSGSCRAFTVLVIAGRKKSEGCKEKNQAYGQSPKVSVHNSRFWLSNFCQDAKNEKKTDKCNRGEKTAAVDLKPVLLLIPESHRSQET